MQCCWKQIQTPTCQLSHGHLGLAYLCRRLLPKLLLLLQVPALHVAASAQAGHTAQHDTTARSVVAWRAICSIYPAGKWTLSLSVVVVQHKGSPWQQLAVPKARLEDIHTPEPRIKVLLSGCQGCCQLSNRAFQLSRLSCSVCWAALGRRVACCCAGCSSCACRGGCHL